MVIPVFKDKPLRPPETHMNTALYISSPYFPPPRLDTFCCVAHCRGQCHPTSHLGLYLEVCVGHLALSSDATLS